MLANYLTDQIQEEAARDDLVREGKLTADEADVLNAAWEEVRKFFVFHGWSCVAKMHVSSDRR